MNRYLEVKKLGRGCFGEVLLVRSADSQDSGQLFALKRVPLDLEDRPRSVSLDTEVRILATLHHPYIVTYYDSFVEDHSLCIVMEYAEAGDLLHRIKAAKTAGVRIAEEQIWTWAAQLLQALSYLHSNKIIHRDLKSRNVFLSHNNEVKLGDFGISRILQFTEDLATTNIGTPYYLAPEVCTGKGYDTKADVWSLGCVLYELCTWRRPFEGEALAAIIQSVMNATYEPINEEWYSSDMRNFIYSMLRKDPAVRPSANDLLRHHCIASLITADPLTAPQKRPSKRTYQREISINIPTPTCSQRVHEPYSAPSPEHARKEEVKTTAHAACTERGVKEEADTEKAQTSRHFTFSESLLKQCPRSPNRPLLMGDFLKRKLGSEVFEQVRQMVLTLPDPGKVLREQPWEFSAVCGEQNLSIVDVGIAFGAFSASSKVPYPPTSTSKAGFRKFPSLRKPSADS
jgi:NIMA (never in mitosis gene a)-related kinase